MDTHSADAGPIEPPRRPLKTISAPVFAAAAIIILLCFVTLCLGLSVSHGLCCADDAWFAIIGKSLATGLGYATTFAANRDVTEPLLFNPYTGTGPTLVIPCAVALMLFGINELVPGIVAIVLWATVFGILFWRISRTVPEWTLLVAVALFCGSVLNTFAFHFEQWHAFLGEVVAAALVLLGHWIAANEKLSSRTLFLAGLCAGLAVQAKVLAVLAAAGLFVIVGVRLIRDSYSLRISSKSFAILIFGCVLPTASFELYKLHQLGSANYLPNWQQFVSASSEMAAPTGTVVSLEMLLQRVRVAVEHFGTTVALLTLLLVAAAIMFRRWSSSNGLLLFAGLGVSITTLAVYWLTLSNGWPRYLVMAVVMICFAVVVPVWSLRRGLDKTVYAILAALLLTPFLTRVPRLVANADRGLFRATTQRIAREALVQEIVEAQEARDVVLAGRWWGSFGDVEFSLPRSMNFKRIETVRDLPGPKLILIDRRFTDMSDPLNNEMKARARDVPFAQGSYELLEVP